MQQCSLVRTNVEKINSLEEKQNRLHEIKDTKIEGVKLRSRCRYKDLGKKPKPTKYVLNLESSNFTSKVINKLVDDECSEYINTADIF